MWRSVAREGRSSGRSACRLTGRCTSPMAVRNERASRAVGLAASSYAPTDIRMSGRFDGDCQVRTGATFNIIQRQLTGTHQPATA